MWQYFLCWPLQWQTKQILTSNIVSKKGYESKWTIETLGWVIVFNAAFRNMSVISWRSVLLLDESGIPRENHRPDASEWQNLLHNVLSSTPRHGAGFKHTTLVAICTVCTCNSKYNCHANTTSTTPWKIVCTVYIYYEKVNVEGVGKTKTLSRTIRPQLNEIKVYTVQRGIWITNSTFHTRKSMINSWR